MFVMQPKPHKSKKPRSYASSVLAVLMIYQLGACPCGCLEHNLWIQMTGVASDHDQEIGSDSTRVVSISELQDAHDHDCTGKPHPQFLDNSQMQKVTGKFSRQGSSFLALAHSSQDDSLAVLNGRGAPSFFPAVSAALTRPALQVYRL